jgi:hypothetical protein
MYAVVRENHYDLEKLARSGKKMAEFNTRHAAQPGYAGNMVVDVSNGRMVIVSLWETEAHAHAARAALEPDIQRLLVPVMTQPSHLIGAGNVPVSDLRRVVGNDETTHAA